MATIVRGPRAADNFTTIANAALRDERLSWKARGLLAYLLSMATGWETSVRRLANAGPDGKSAIETALWELEALGYLERRQARADGDKAGEFSGIEYYVCDESTVDGKSGNGDGPTVDGLSVDGSTVPGESATKKNSPKNNPPEEDFKSSSGALRAPTAPPVETSRSNVTPGNARAGAAAAESSDDHGDAPRADPDQILASMLVNPDEGARFRAWLVQATNATNPDGLIVSLHSAGRLSERLAQWRTAESTQNPATPPAPASSTPPARLEWCGRCDATTRTTIELDGNGREYVRRCPTCNINAGNATPGTGAVQAITQQAARAAANQDGGGRAAFLAARAALPQGVGRRVTTIGEPVDPATTRRAESEQNA